jgi:outer membrane protein TolC
MSENMTKTILGMKFIREPLKALAISAIILISTGCAIGPTPLKDEEIVNRMTKDRLALYEGQEPITGPLQLEEVMARALKYNMDHRLKLMEDALSLRQLDVMKFDMLPRLVAAAGYNVRDRYNAASSMDVVTEQQSLAPSTSQDKSYHNADLTVAWNILDFGVSYFQTRQQADRTLVMAQRRRKVVQTIMQQVSYAYWLSLGAQHLEGRFEPLLKEVDQALRESGQIESEKLRPPMETLTYQKTLLEILKQLEAFRDELSQAKTRLASLINFPPGEPLKLAMPNAMDIPGVPEGVKEMEVRALLMRPELLEADYNERISADEVRKAVARMFPGIEISAGWHYDSNSFLYWNNWFDGGIRVTWNLLNLLSGPTQYKIATAQRDLAGSQRLALSMAVLTQVNLSYLDFFSRQRQYEISKRLQEIDAGILQQTRNALQTGTQSRLNEIRAATSALMAEFRKYQNYAALQNAYSQIVASVGIDILPESVDGHDIKTLALAIQSSLKKPWKPIPVHHVIMKAPSSSPEKGVTP